MKAWPTGPAASRSTCSGWWITIRATVCTAFPWGKTPERYVNLDAAQVMHFPGYSKAAAELLVHRDVVGIGIDTLPVTFMNKEHRLSMTRGMSLTSCLVKAGAFPHVSGILNGP
jgi:kynurenine formamidase